MLRYIACHACSNASFVRIHVYVIVYVDKPAAVAAVPIKKQIEIDTDKHALHTNTN